MEIPRFNGKVYEMFEPTPQEQEIFNVLDLIVAEFESDPMSVQCFDPIIVDRAKAIIQQFKEMGMTHKTQRR